MVPGRASCAMGRGVPESEARHVEIRPMILCVSMVYPSHPAAFAGCIPRGSPGRVGKIGLTDVARARSFPMAAVDTVAWQRIRIPSPQVTPISPLRKKSSVSKARVPATRP